MAIDPPEIVRCDSPKVSCDGGGVLGHPRVYYDLAREGWAECGYCDRRFVWTGFKGAGKDSGEDAAPPA